MRNIYQDEIQFKVERYYGPLLFAFDKYDSIQNHLEDIAIALHQGISQKNKYLFYQLNNYNKDFIGKSIEELSSLSFSLHDAKNTVAQEYGFGSWEELSSLNPIPYQIAFQKAIDILLSGDEEVLQQTLKDNPELVKLRSNYGHRASLFHYVASNGVEMWRQKVPLNLPRLTNILLDHGADKDALMKVYGGNFNTFDLLITSAHPKQAGILKEMKSLLS